MRLSVLVAALTMIVPAHIAHSAPQVYAPVLAVWHNQDITTDNPNKLVLMSINGTGFGTPQNGNFLRASCGTQAGGAFVILLQGNSLVFTAGSTDSSRVYSWSDTQIVLQAGTGIANKDNLVAQVCTGTGASGTAGLSRYTYTHYDVPPSSGTNPSPLAIARGSGTTWINEEFHRGLKGLNTSSQWTNLTIPQVVGTGIFAQTVFGNTPTRTSSGGEDVLVDTLGRVWFTEAGSAPYNEACVGGTNAGAACNQQSECPGGTCGYPNRSRVVMFNPTTQAFGAYNVPGDNTGVFGLAWDAATQRIWFTQERRSVTVGFVNYVAQRARVTSFSPSGITADNYFNFSAQEACTVPTGQFVGSCSTHTSRACINDNDCVLAGQVCPPGTQDDSACFHEYEIPDTDGAVLLPAHVLRHSDGSIWYSAYWGGNHLGRLDAATGGIQMFPLPAPVDQANCNYNQCYCFGFGQPACPDTCCSYLLLGSGPWSVVEASNHDVLLSYQNQPAVGRFSYAQWQANPSSCASLDGNGQNPCLTNSFVPAFDQAHGFHHSVGVDAQGNAWLTQFQGDQNDCSQLTTIALLPAGTTHVLLFPPFSFYPNGANPCVAFSGTGVAFDSATSTTWFADYWRKRLGKLAPN